MADVPQPSPEPHEVGDTVRVYANEGDIDSRFQDTVCTVIERFEDDTTDTEDDLEHYSYRLENADTGEELPSMFDHSDLVSVE